MTQQTQQHQGRNRQQGERDNKLGRRGGLEDMLEALRHRAAETYRRGDEQYTAFTWAAGIRDEWPSSVETGNVRRYVRDLAVLAVGFSGQPYQDGVIDLTTVITPIRGEAAVADQDGVHHERPIDRTFAPRATFGRRPFEMPIESKWAKSAGYLAEQLLSLLQVTRGERIEQSHHVFGPTAVRTPKFAVNLTPPGKNADGVPDRPTYNILEEIEDSAVLETVDLSTLVFDMETMPPAIDIRGWTKTSRPVDAKYGLSPWFVLPGNIRTIHADLGILRAHWWLG